MTMTTMTSTTTTTAMMMTTKSTARRGPTPNKVGWLPALFVIPVTATVLLGANAWVVGNDPRANAVASATPVSSTETVQNESSPEVMRILAEVDATEKRTRRILEKLRLRAEASESDTPPITTTTTPNPGPTNQAQPNPPTTPQPKPIPAPAPQPAPQPEPAPPADTSTGASG